MPKFQFSLRALLVAVVVAAAFFGGVRFGERRERERRKLADELEAEQLQQAFEAAMKNRSVRDTIIISGDDDRDTTRGWRKARAEAVETQGFSGLSPAR